MAINTVLINNEPLQQVFGLQNFLYAMQINSLVQRSWPKYICEDPIGKRLYPWLFLLFPDYQFTLIQNGEVIAIANTVPLRFDEPLTELPDEGWHWAIQKAFADQKARIKPNYLCLLSAVVKSDMRGAGMAATALSMMNAIGKKKGLIASICPVRPNKKCEYIDEDINTYIQRTNDNGLPFDPWLRSHIRGGGEIIKVCHRSMVIKGTIRCWERWEGRSFPESGEYVINGGTYQVKS